MIEATYYPGECCLTVKGHACTAPKGEDIVCASASILIQTLAEDVRILEEQGALHEMSIRLDPGDAEVRCTPCKQMGAIVDLVYHSVVTGYCLLQRAYPETVIFSELEEKTPAMGLETGEQ